MTEHFDGTVEVRELTEAEKRARAARHLAALKALGSPIESVEAELAKLSGPKETTTEPSPKPVASTSKSPSRGRATPASGGGGGGVALERTDRIEPSSDDEEIPTTPTVLPPSARSTPASTPRPSPPLRSNSAMQAMRHMFIRSTSTSRSPDPARAPSRFVEEPEVLDEDEELAAPSNTIRFADMDRPSREGSTGTGRPLPVVGGGLALRREPTMPKS